MRANGLRNLTPSQRSDLHGTPSGTGTRKKGSTQITNALVLLLPVAFPDEPRKKDKRWYYSFVLGTSSPIRRQEYPGTDAATLPREAAACSAGVQTPSWYRQNDTPAEQPRRTRAARLPHASRTSRLGMISPLTWQGSPTR